MIVLINEKIHFDHIHHTLRIKNIKSEIRGICLRFFKGIEFSSPLISIC